MLKLESFYSLLEVLNYGKNSAQTADELAKVFGLKCDSDFINKLKSMSHESRLHGHWVIDDEAGYYIAVSQEEWNKYAMKRFLAIGDELQELSVCSNLSLSDLIKNIYAVTVNEKNYSLF